MNAPDRTRIWECECGGQFRAVLYAWSDPQLTVGDSFSCFGCGRSYRVKPFEVVESGAGLSGGDE